MAAVPGAVAVVLVILVTAGCGARQRGLEPFDAVVMVTIDTLRADHLGCYGYPRPVSPFIDSLAEEGVRFSNAFSTSSHTAISHASLLTSQYPGRHRVLVNGTALDAATPTVASLLGGEGYETFAYVSTRFLREIAVGFDEVVSPPRRPRGPWQANQTVDAAIEGLRRRDRAAGFFLWIHLFDVHSSHGPITLPPERYLRLMEEDREASSQQLEELWKNGHGLVAGVASVEQLDTYDAQIAFVDDQLRRLFDFLSQSEPETRVLWVITSDHGEGLGNHRFLGHGKYLYQEQIHVPLIFYAESGLERGRTCEALVRHVDLLPTLAELTGLTLEGRGLQLEGRSLVPLIEGSEVGEEPRYAYARRRPPDEARVARGWPPGLALAVTDGRYKYIHYSDAEDELYDLESDPLETTNLISQGLPEQERLAAWAARTIEASEAAAAADPDQLHIEEEYVDELRELGYLE